MADAAQEGLRTTVVELGKSDANLREIGQRLSRRGAIATVMPATINLGAAPTRSPARQVFCKIFLSDTKREIPSLTVDERAEVEGIAGLVRLFCNSEDVRLA